MWWDEFENGNYFGEAGKIAKIHDEFVAMLKNLNETSCKGLLKDAGGSGLMVGVTPYDGDRPKVLALLKRLF